MSVIIKMRLRIFYCLILMASPVLAGAVTIENVRIWPAPDSTRVVFDITGPVQHNTFMLTDPYRAVIDLKNTTMSSKATQPSGVDKYLQRVRTATSNDKDFRVVLDLKKMVTYKSFQLKPNKHYGHRLVIDLYGDEEQEVKTAKIDKALTRVDQLRDVVVAIDAGHGGEDPGAKGPRGNYEKNIVLKIAKQLAGSINKERGMRAVLIREGDYYMSLRRRIKKARQHKADMFISIHADAFHDPRVRGSSVYVLSQKGASSEAAKWLAKNENEADLIGGVNLDQKDNMLASVLLDLSQTASLEASIDIADRVLKGLKKLGKVHKRNVQSAGFAVLKSPDVPSILIETAFISNPAEEKKLLSRKYQRNLVNAILVGLRGYFKDFAPVGTLLASRKHVIEHGDTLSTIAKQYNVSMEKLRQFNSLKGDLIRTGQVLQIPNNNSDT